MGTTVKTLRSLRTQSVDGQVRHFGDFLPEAEEWPNLQTYLRSGYIEVAYIDSDDLARELEKQRANDIVLPVITSGAVTSDAAIGAPVVPTTEIPVAGEMVKVPLTPEEINALVDQAHPDPVDEEVDEDPELTEEEIDDQREEIVDDIPEEEAPAVKLKLSSKKPVKKVGTK